MKPLLKKYMHFLIAGTMNWQLKRFRRRNLQVKIVAVTGSVGKTTTKLAILAVLSKKYRVLAHPGNYNSDTGVPLSVFELESPGNILNLGAWLGIIWIIEQKLHQPFKYDVIVQELGASRDKEIRYFSYLKPDIGVVTAAKPAHLEGFGSMEVIVNEKFSLAQYSELALINAEDARLMQKIGELPSDKVKTYGLGRGDYDFEVSSFDTASGFRGRMKLNHETEFEVHLQLMAAHNVQSAVAAAAVGHMMDVPAADIKAGLEEIRPVNGRMNPLAGKNESLIIDDTYNGSPEAITAALETLYSMPGRHIAIIGGMNELGVDSQRYHHEVGEHLGKLDLLVTIAEFAKQYIDPARESGLKPEQIKSFATPYQAGEYVAQLLRPGDKVLVKGSQGGIFAEEATAKLLANPADVNRLVRQSSFWQKIKHRTFELNRPTAEN